MNRLIPRTIVEIPEHDPVIAYKKLMKDMRSPYRHHTYEIGKTYHSHCFAGDYCIEGFFPMPCTNAWAGDIVFEVAIWGKVFFINHDNIESEYLKILKKEDEIFRRMTFSIERIHDEEIRLQRHS